jgi:exopolysaccharide production protein ExoQ
MAFVPASRKFTYASPLGWLVREPLWAWALLLAFLPVLSGVIFRTYSYHVTPGWLELYRQFDAPFVLFEIAVALYARERGLNMAAQLSRLSTSERVAAALFFTTFWIASAFVSQVPGLSLLRIVTWVVHIWFGFALFHLMRGVTADGTACVAKAALIGLCAYVPLLVLHFALAPDPAAVPGGRIIWSSALPGYLSVRLFGFTTAVAAILLAAVAWQRRKSSDRTGWVYAGFLLALTLTFWSGTRGGYIAVLIVLAVLPLMARANPGLRWLMAMALCVLVAAVVSEWLPHPDSGFGLFRTSDGWGANQFTSGRMEIWLQTIGWISERPLLGWGESATLWLLKDGAGHQQPHNALLQMLQSWGVVATAAALFLAARAAARILVALPREPLLIVPTAALLGLAVMASVDGILYNPRTTLLVVVALSSALVLASAQKGLGQPDSGDLPDKAHST